jgi:hypothetical protein
MPFTWNVIPVISDVVSS